jgi:glycosyltransferase involved in cell wall biosynthesis
VAKFLMSFKPDIVHAVQFTAGLWTAVPSRVSGVGSFVYSLHGMPSTDRRFVRVLERLFIYPFADQVLSVSTAAATEFERRYPRLRRPVRVIANGVDASKFGCLPHRREATAGPIVISVGRLDPLKDFGTLVEAFALVSREVPSARLWIVGEGTERSALERKVGALGLGDTVELLGYRADIHMLLQQADVFVSTSISECLPNVHLEAMASGKAIVATKVGGVGEILDETTAILVAPGDVEAVGVAITNLLTDRALAHRLATSARAQVDAKWDFRHRVRRIQSFYKELTAVGA